MLTRTIRILLDPNAPEGGNGAAPHGDLQRPPVGAPGGATQTIPVSVDEYKRFRETEAALAAARNERQAMLDAAERSRLDAMASEGKSREAMDELRKSYDAKLADATKRHADLEATVSRDRVTASLADALQGRNFVGDTPEAKAGTAAMVRKLLADDFETSRDGSGNLIVRDKTTGRPAADVLKERLDSPQFAIFFAASHGGGSGHSGTTPFAASAQDKERAELFKRFGIDPTHGAGATGLAFQ